MNMPPRKLLAFLLLFILFNFIHPPSVLAENASFDLSSFSLRNITLLGDSFLRNGVIGLTRELGVPSSSSDSVIFNYLVRFFNPETNVTTSFSTKFYFSINNINPTSFGDGLAFFMSPDNQTLGSPGGYLGLVNSSQSTKNNFIAIEFDTYLDSHFNDPNENHIGLNIDNLNSIKTTDPFLQGVDLKSGNSITAWIDYKNNLREFMYVGFSASTEGSTELHLTENWSFQTSGFLPVRPRSHPHNVSDNSVVTITPPIPLSDSTNKQHKRISLGLGIAGSAFFCVALTVFGYISVKKWKGIRM